MKKVWCLYRVSTKSQVNNEDDIPLQKNACLEFIKRQDNWILCKELYEKGVSGWKKSIKDRDALNEIKKGAINQELDILLVFMFDRIGRKEDETPLVIDFLSKLNVEVWSVQEGKKSMDTHVDKLINYISFWQSSGESLKTSLRVRESKKQLSQQGYFQGGVAPYGYEICDSGIKHWKDPDRNIKELRVNQNEANIVKVIFDLYVNKNYGIKRITTYLNENGFRTRLNKKFHTSLISRILRNPIYIGFKRYNSFDGETNGVQPFNEHLLIISTDDFNKAKKIRGSRNKESQDKTNIPTKGKLLFSGISRCYYCNSKLTANYLYRNSKKKDGTPYKLPIYRYTCPLNKGKDKNHDQYVWGAKKYDEIIINEVKNILRKLPLKDFLDPTKSMRKTIIKTLEGNLKKLRREAKKIKDQLEILYNEIPLSLENKSVYSAVQLSTAINNHENNLNIKMVVIEKLDMKIIDIRNINNYESKEEDLKNWEEKFDNADEDRKKNMLANLIDTIHLGKNKVIITFNIYIAEILRECDGIK